jgi:hypothetical protein
MLVSLSSLSLAACGSNTPDPSDWFPEDIDQDATLDALGDAGLGQVCSAFSDFVHDQYRSNYLVQAVCTAHAIRTTTDAIACADATEACLDELPPAVDAELDAILDQASCPALGVEAEGCPSTVSALKACLDALGSSITRLQFTLTCAAAGEPIPENWSELVIPASCMALQDGCTPA